MMDVPNDLGGDPAGLELWSQRNQLVPSFVQRAFEEEIHESLVSTILGSVTRWDITGVGSSEAHGRLLAYGLNSIGKSARFVPLSAYWSGFSLGNLRPAGQIVFSQGLSNNAQIALNPEFEYKHRILVTAATQENLKEAGKDDRALRLEILEAQGGRILGLFPAEEYTILIRVLGPAVGFAKVIKLLGACAPDQFAPPSSEHVADAMEEGYALGEEAADRWDLDLSATPHLASIGFPADLLFNLACKWVEGIFYDAPNQYDVMALSHGPFQQSTRAPRPLYLLTGPDESDRQAVEKVQQLWEAVKAPLREVQSPLPFPASLLYYEAFFNALMVRFANRLDVNQVEWPGKGLDGPLYGLDSRL